MFLWLRILRSLHLCACFLKWDFLRHPNSWMSHSHLASIIHPSPSPGTKWIPVMFHSAATPSKVLVMKVNRFKNHEATKDLRLNHRVLSMKNLFFGESVAVIHNFWTRYTHLRWNLKMMVSNRNLLFQGATFRFHVKLWQGIKIGLPKRNVVFQLSCFRGYVKLWQGIPQDPWDDCIYTYMKNHKKSSTCR